MLIRTPFLSSQVLISAAIAAFGFVGSAQGATNWNATFNSGCNSGTTYASAGNWGFCGTQTGGVGAEFAGLDWKYSNSSLTLPPTNPTAITDASTASNGSVVSWGSNGLGIYSPTSSEAHSVDNGNKYIDSVVLRFNKSVTMNELSIGWKDGDSDITVFAWTGPTPASPNPSPTSLTGGWTTVAQLNNVSVSSNTSFVSSTSSSYWLVAALGGDTHVDSFKLLSVAGIYGGTTPPGGSTPEPGSLALLGLGAAGLLAARRKSQARR